MSQQYDYDLFVIGAGSGGVRAARMAAATGVRVAVAESGRTGGTCVNLGCVPKKLYVHAAEYGAAFAQAAGFGWSRFAPSLDWPVLQKNKDQVISNSNRGMEKMLETSGARLLRGRARITGPHQVAMDGVTYSARRILIATGARPFVPKLPGSAFLRTSDDIFALEQLPQSVLIVGGGYIATEFAGILHGLGVKVTQIYRGELFLRGFDAEIRAYIAEHMRKKGIDLRFDCDLHHVDKNPDGTFTTTLKDGTTLTTGLVMAATGRLPNSADLGLEDVGVEVSDKGAVRVNDAFQTSVPSIYAIGDVIDRMQLTPVALAEAMHLVGTLYQEKTGTFSYELIPTAVFSQPNLGCVGLTEEEALDRYSRVDVYTAEFRSLKQALSGTTERILMKLLVDAERDRIVGAHMAGEGAGEIIQGIAIALKAGATKTIFDQTIGIHPTSAEEFVTMRTPTRRHGAS